MIYETLKSIDYKLLRQQKQYLLGLPSCEQVDGLINLIDAIQDAVVADNLVDSHVVYS